MSALSYYKVKGNNLPLNVVWARKTNEPRALAPDRGNGFPRTAACLYAMDADQIVYTFASTLQLKAEHDYKVSLYFLDWDHRGRKIAI